MATEEEIKQKLEELRKQKIALKPFDEQEQAPAPVNIARGMEEKPVAEKKLPPLPQPPKPPYAMQATPALTRFEERQLEKKTGEQAKEEEEEIVEELLPAVKKISAVAPAEVAKREEAPQAITAAVGQMTSQPQAGVIPMHSLSRREQRRLEREQRKAAIEARVRPGMQQTQEISQQALSLEDLLPKEEDAKEKAPAAEGIAGEGKSLFEELAQVSGPAERKPSVVEVQVEKKEPLACPTCKAQNTRVVFCPYCGTGMCANCSPTIKPEEDFFVFTCPHCSEEVNVKKKPAQALLP